MSTQQTGNYMQLPGKFEKNMPLYDKAPHKNTHQKSAPKKKFVKADVDEPNGDDEFNKVCTIDFESIDIIQLFECRFWRFVLTGTQRTMEAVDKQLSAEGKRLSLAEREPLYIEANFKYENILAAIFGGVASEQIRANTKNIAGWLGARCAERYFNSKEWMQKIRHLLNWANRPDDEYIDEKARCSFKYCLQIPSLYLSKLAIQKFQEANVGRYNQIFVAIENYTNQINLSAIRYLDRNRTQRGLLPLVPRLSMKVDNCEENANAFRALQGLVKLVFIDFLKSKYLKDISCKFSCREDGSDDKECSGKYKEIKLICNKLDLDGRVIKKTVKSTSGAPRQIPDNVTVMFSDVLGPRWITQNLVLGTRLLNLGAEVNIDENGISVINIEPKPAPSHPKKTAEVATKVTESVNTEDEN